jgi:signal peptidase I
MSRGQSTRPDPDEESVGEDEEEAPKAKPRHSRTSRPPKRKKSGSHRAVQRWESGEGGGPGDETDDEEARCKSRPGSGKPVYWRARDSLYFEPVVALAIVVLLLVCLFAYTQNWPPVYVVESESMQHGLTDQVGLINTGDLVLAQKIPNASIQPYFVGLRNGYTTYGEYGDVLLYQPNGVSGTPVIHRSILYLDWDPASRSYSAPSLQGLPCGNAPNADYATPGTAGNCSTSDLTGALDLYRVGWMSVNVTLDLAAPALGEHSGFVTMGDNNFVCTGPGDCFGEPDQEGAVTPAISSLVEPGWVVGAARGMIPWFGAIKLLLAGQASMVPPQSWQYLGLTIVGIIALAFGVHFALRREGVETPLRKREDEEDREAHERDAEEEPADEGGGRHILQRLRPWHHPDEEGAAADDAERSKDGGATAAPGRHGRPKPQVKRSEKKRHVTEDDDL